MQSQKNTLYVAVILFCLSLCACSSGSGGAGGGSGEGTSVIARSTWSCNDTAKALCQEFVTTDSMTLDHYEKRCALERAVWTQSNCPVSSTFIGKCEEVLGPDDITTSFHYQTSSQTKTPTRLKDDCEFFGDTWTSAN